VKHSPARTVRKRPVNLTLGEDLVEEGRTTAALWNDFAEQKGSFADEHSTL